MTFKGCELDMQGSLALAICSAKVQTARPSVPSFNVKERRKKEELTDGVSASSVFGNSSILVIRFLMTMKSYEGSVAAMREKAREARKKERTDPRSMIIRHILQNGAKLDGAKDLGFLLRIQPYALGIATSFNVEDSSVGPNVLVVADELPVGIGGEGGFACAGESEEERDITVDTFVGGGMKGELSKLDRLQVVLFVQLCS